MKKYKRKNLTQGKPTLRKSTEVPGLLHTDHNGINQKTIDVFVTCDARGKSISFSELIEGVMITVPVEPLADLLKEVLEW